MRRDSVILLVSQLLTFFASTSIASACERIYVFDDQTNYPLVKLEVHGAGITHPGALDSISSRSGKIFVRGDGSAKIIAVLSGGRTLTKEIDDVCAATQITITIRNGEFRLIIN